MQQDRYAAPEYPYIPHQAPEPYRMAKFARDCIGWGLLAVAGGLAICAVLIIADSLMSS